MRQSQALHIMLSGKSVFLTGAPGAGKTYVLNEFIRRAQTAGKRLAVTASTGIAATHIAGTTIHSWSGLGIKEKLTGNDTQWLASNDRLRKRYNSADILIIDEISMLHGARLDMVNAACKLLRENDAPFGGLQVILVGDLFQLPPVNRVSELVDFAHLSAAWHELDPEICYLNEQHRQAGDALLDLLTAMRSGELDTMHIEALQARRTAKPTSEMAVTRLYTHNIDVEAINQRYLDTLDSETKSYKMIAKGTAAKVEQLIKSVLAPQELTVKVGAEVMFVANDYTQGFVNGSRGQVTGFKDGMPLVRVNNGRVIKVEPHTWALTEDDRKRAEVAQLPLRLAWAITIHKSQGMSLDAAEIDLSKSFTPGMGYVALSRVRSIDGVYLTGINNLALQLHPDIYEFDRQLRQASNKLAATTPDISETVADTDVSDSDTIINRALLDDLRRWRLDRAKHDRIAPFMVAHNSSLEALAEHPPRTRQQLLGIKGFGPSKVEQYGDEILQTIQEHQITSDLASDSSLPVTELIKEPLASLGELDRQLLQILKQRQTITDHIARISAVHHMPTSDPERDRAALRAIANEAVALDLDPVFAATILQLLHNHNAKRHTSST